MGFLGEFKKFAMRGNVIDMSVGIIIGAAFGKIVDSMVKDILMPGIGMLVGNVDFSNIFITLKHGKQVDPYNSLAQAVADGAVTINIGVFINTFITFIIVAFAVFLLIRTINKVDKNQIQINKQKSCPECFEKINIKAKRCPNCTSKLD